MTTAHAALTERRRSYSPRWQAHYANQDARMSEEDRNNARRDFHAQAAIVADLQDRLDRAKRQLADDREYMHDIEQEAAKHDHAADVANARYIATRTAARRRALLGLPAIRPLSIFLHRGNLRTVTIPSRCSKFPHGSTPRNVMVEHAWHKRAKFVQCKLDKTPAVKQAAAIWSSFWSA